MITNSNKVHALTVDRTIEITHKKRNLWIWKVTGEQNTRNFACTKFWILLFVDCLVFILKFIVITFMVNDTIQRYAPQMNVIMMWTIALNLCWQPQKRTTNTKQWQENVMRSFIFIWWNKEKDNKHKGQQDPRHFDSVFTHAIFVAFYGVYPSDNECSRHFDCVSSTQLKMIKVGEKNIMKRLQ